MNRMVMIGCLLAGILGCGTPPATMATDVSLAPPSLGFQLATPPFEVPAGQEIQSCYFFKVPDLNGGQPFFVDKIEIAQNIGSHHMNIFRQGTVLAPDPMVPGKGLQGPNPDGTGVVISMNGKGACFYSANWADWPLVVNTQQGGNNHYVLQLPTTPDRVGHKFMPGEILMLQTHYVNATTQKTPGRGLVFANFNQMADTTNVVELGTLFATEQSISICRDNPDPQFTGFCHMNNTTGKPLTILGANGHFHSRGTDFTICPWDGTSTDACTATKFYESTTWDDPPMMTGLNVLVPAGVGTSPGGIAWTCKYHWAPSPACAGGCSCLKDPVNCCYKFGGVVETSEHCNAFVYYYPKIDRMDINCK